jgi:hypothetical protein
MFYVVCPRSHMIENPEQVIEHNLSNFPCFFKVLVNLFMIMPPKCKIPCCDTRALKLFHPSYNLSRMMKAWYNRIGCNL